MNVQLKTLKNKNGKELNDYQLFKIALKNIEEYNNTHTKRLPFDPSFVQFMKDYISEIDMGNSDAKIKKACILQTYDINVD